MHNNKLASILGAWLAEGEPYAFFVPVLRNQVLPHAWAFGYLVVAGELFVGAALLAGLFTRWAALGGLVMTIVFLLARGDGAGPNPTAPFVLICFTLLVTHPGRVLGLDAILRDKVPSWLS
jgi:thiosulfate dehydrogenase [quinone] large subunit